MKSRHPYFSRLAVAAAAAIAIAAPQAASAADRSADAAIAALKGGAARVSLNSATGRARFVRLAPAAPAAKAAPAALQATAEKASADFLKAYGAAFGIRNAASELSLVRAFDDKNGGRHLVYGQVYNGLPVFGAEMRTHTVAGQLRAVNGVFVPDLSLSTAPARSFESVAKVAVGKVATDKAAKDAAAGRHRLVIFREGLVKGVPGKNHLAWEVEVTDRKGAIREFVYMDAHTGKYIDQISGIADDLNRRAYDGANLPTVPPSYPDSPFWVEGDAFPTGTVEADNMIEASEETYNYFKNTFDRDSFDGNGATMDSIFNRGYSCPNASWNGTFISFCPGFTTDDVTGHEWGHAYTQFTHNLIYQWQSGALNEAYSDMWGETIDQLNGRGLDSPGGARTDGSCTAFITPPPVLRVNAPASIAGNYAVGGADFGPPLTGTGITGDVVLVNDGVGDAGPPTGGGNLSVMDGCETPFVNAAAVAGKIALIYRGTCSFAAKVANAEANGAVAVIISNHALGGNAPFGLGGDGVNFPNIPAVGLGNANGDLLRANLPANATLRLDETPTVDNSYRWLMGEEVTPGGALRDMWNPVCASNPGKVSDVQYTCGASDQGGVHTNSGVPNHAFALLVDGGTYNGQTIAGLGFNKVAPIYFRAQTVYQTPSSNFADHADALEQSCADLIGATLVEAYTGAPTTDVLDADDCQQVAKATLAVELRTEPVQCNFQPLLAKDPPPVCAAGDAAVNLFRESFNEGSARWTTTHNARRPADFTDRDWQVVSNLPDGRDGSAMFAVDPTGGTCAPGGDESAVLHLSSKAIKIPNGVTEPLLTFDHWVATEANFDGGNLKVSVNGGDWQLVPAANFTYNPYNMTLVHRGAGQHQPAGGRSRLQRHRSGQRLRILGNVPGEPHRPRGCRRLRPPALRLRQRRLRRRLWLVRHRHPRVRLRQHHGAVRRGRRRLRRGGRSQRPQGPLHGVARAHVQPQRGRPIPDGRRHGPRRQQRLRGEVGLGGDPRRFDLGAGRHGRRRRPHPRSGRALQPEAHPHEPGHDPRQPRHLHDR